MSTKPIVVAGSINMDLVVNPDRMPRPGETVFGSRIQYIPGGKGSNQAIAARRLGDAPVALIGKVGEDSFGDSLLQFLSSQNLLLDGVSRCPTATGTAIITVDSTSQNAIVVVPGANFEMRTADIDAMKDSISEAGVVVTQLEIPTPVVEHFLKRAKENRATTILNAAPAKEVAPDILEAVDYLVVNETELAVMAEQAEIPDEMDAVVASARRLQDRGARNIVVTLGPKGSITLAGTEVMVIDGIKVNALDPTGAGDCLVGGLAAQLTAGADLRQALNFANRAAALSVQRVGASSSIPHASELADS